MLSKHSSSDAATIDYMSRFYAKLPASGTASITASPTWAKLIPLKWSYLLFAIID
jgi:hypothetical protein